VQFYQGEYSTWSAQQVLSPSPYVNTLKNYFGSALAFDRDNYDTLYLACGNCSTTAGKGHGAIYLYEQDKHPGKNHWSQTQIITSSKLSGLGMGKIGVSKDLLLATTTSNGPVLFRKTGGEYTPEQIIGVGMTVSNFEVYDNVIVLGSTSIAKGGFTNVGAVYILGSAKPPPLKGKPMPVQWSVQQVLYPPTPANSLKFGQVLSLDGDRLAVVNGAAGDNAGYIFEKSTNTGKWSLQQTLAEPTGSILESYAFLRGSDMVLFKDTAKIAYYDQFPSAECLVIAVEDQFGDGWDLAKLVATAPDGSKEYYSARCDLTQPHKFRYCPSELGQEGIYHFEVVDAAGKSKNFWEIQWRVFDEAKAVWYVGDHTTKMDFEWDSVYKTFTPRKMDHVLKSNATCNYCPPVPTYKPTPVLRSRALKGGDDTNWPGTRHPTSTPAPTLATTNIGNWRVMTLKTANKWFNYYHGAAYYVSDAKSRRLITTGTLCPGEASGKQCWVDLPDGYYNIRVGGALLADPTQPKWTFCRAKNDIGSQTQISVKIQDGECTALARHLVSSFCATTTATATVLIEFLVLGVASDSLGSDDNNALRSAIAYAFPGLTTADVNIASVVPSSGGLFVSANVQLSSEMGYDVLSVDGLESATAAVQTYMATSGPKAIWSGLQSAEHRTIFSTSTSVQYVSAELTGSSDKVVSAATVADQVASYADETTTSADNSKSASSSVLVDTISTSGYFLAVAGVAALVVGMFVASRRTKAASSPAAPVAGQKDYTELEATEHSTSSRVQLKDLYSSPPTVSDLKNLVESVSSPSLSHSNLSHCSLPPLYCRRTKSSR
jgi:hypothetical protein